MLFFTCLKLVAQVLVCACVITHIKWQRLGGVLQIRFFEIVENSQENTCVGVSSALRSAMLLKSDFSKDVFT